MCRSKFGHDLYGDCLVPLNSIEEELFSSLFSIKHLYIIHVYI